MKQYQHTLNDEDSARKLQNDKQREFNKFIEEIANACFTDCVTTYEQPRQTLQERKCIDNCVRQILTMHSSLGEAMD